MRRQTENSVATCPCTMELGAYRYHFQKARETETVLARHAWLAIARGHHRRRFIEDGDSCREIEQKREVPSKTNKHLHIVQNKRLISWQPQRAWTCSASKYMTTSRVSMYAFPLSHGRQHPNESSRDEHGAQDEHGRQNSLSFARKRTPRDHRAH